MNHEELQIYVAVVLVGISFAAHTEDTVIVHVRLSMPRTE